MPEYQGRSGSEEQLIREFAYQLWEEDGRPDGRERENWLEAEARLRVRKAISPKPVALCEFSVTAPRSSAERAPTRVVCPIPEGVDVTFFDVSISRLEAAYGPPAMPLESVVHDARSALVEFATATVFLDRIARLAEWVALGDQPSAAFLEHDPSWGVPRLRSPYIKALLEPATHKEMVGEIDGVISNYPYASLVVFDMTGVALESPVTIRGIWKVFTAFAVLTASSILEPIIKAEAPEAGRIVGGIIAQGYQRSKERLEHDREQIARLYEAEMAEGNARVKVMQRLLDSIGYHPGPIDGKFGPLTLAAAQKFCLDHGVVYDGPNGKAMRKQLAHVAAQKIRD